MRLFAEEFKLGTIEPLMTAPVRDWQVVLAKFFGALIFYIVLWMPTILYFAVLSNISLINRRRAQPAPIGARTHAASARNVLSFASVVWHRS